jgi:mannose-1-phosphate guanylyltransferase
MLSVANAPVTEHQVARAVAAGVTRVILGTSYKADVFSTSLGDGSHLGAELVYVVEDEPLGTGGAIRNTAAELRSGPDDPVLVFNGDILSGVDIAGLVQAWRDAEADVAIYLTRVDDPRAYGLVPTDAGGRVVAFLEKPERDEDIVTDQINAGVYVFKRSIIDSIPSDRPVSVERETFPALLATGAKVIGFVDDAYWLDLGNPLAFVQGSRDLVTGVAPSPLVAVKGQSLLGVDVQVAGDATVTGGSALGARVIVESGAVVDGSVLLDDVVVESGAVVRDSVIGAGARIGTGTSLHGVAVGDHAVIGALNELVPGARVWPGITIADASVRHSSDK